VRISEVRQRPAGRKRTNSKGKAPFYSHNGMKSGYFHLDLTGADGQKNGRFYPRDIMKTR
jgi:hypothetical protein